MMGGLEPPARVALAVVPDDANDLVNTTRSIYVGTAGGYFGSHDWADCSGGVQIRASGCFAGSCRPDFGKWNDGKQYSGVVVNGCSLV